MPLIITQSPERLHACESNQSVAHADAYPICTQKARMGGKTQNVEYRLGFCGRSCSSCL